MSITTNASSQSAASSPARSTPAQSTSPRNAAVYVTTAEELDAYYFVVDKKDKGAFWEVRVFDKNGNQQNKFKVLFEEVHVFGPKMPFLEMKKNGTTSFDGGVSLPTGTMNIDLADKDVKGDLAKALIRKIDDAACAFLYKLAKPGVFIRSIERVQVGTDQDPLFTPRVHYSDGGKIDITKDTIVFDPKNMMRYFEPDKKTKDVYFTNFSLVRPGKYSKGHLYLDFGFAIPFGQRSLKRKKNEAETDQQRNPRSWDINIPQLAKIDGVWRVDARAGNMYPKMACIDGPGKRAAFTGNVAIGIEDIWPGEQFSLKFTGNASVISQASADDEGPYAPFGQMPDDEGTPAAAAKHSIEDSAGFM